jgi:uncharacterized repeat protein (TIGR03803 family)
MNQTRWFFPVTRTPAVLLVLAIFASNLSAAEWKEKVLYSFQGVTDGATPVGGVVFDKAGNLYGATQDGGSSNCRSIYQCGTVYQLAPPEKKGDPWTETVLYVFKGNASNDGASPFGGLVMDSAGNLYGTTAYGGTGDCVLLGAKLGCGAVYELSPPTEKGEAWTETVLYSFPSAEQGYVPRGDLVFDSAGNLYGATIFGGAKGTTCDPYYGGQCGVVFELSPPKTKGGQWAENVLHSFAGISNGLQTSDGANPNGGLVLDSKGNVYGTTYIGGYNCPHGSEQGCGTAFALERPTEKGGLWAETVLHRFKRDSSDGGNPMAGLRFDGAGHLYGTTLNGGPGQYGTVFSLGPPSKGAGAWVETVLHGFNGDRQGEDPEAGLTFDAHGYLYGTALGGGADGGVVFRLKPPRHGDSWPLNVLYNFTGSPDADHPTAALVLDSEGNLYSTTDWGGSGQACQGGCGTVFEVEP